MDLFGTTDIEKIGFRDLTLPAHPGVTLKDAKMKSLSKKYFSIPQEILDYYPKYKGKGSFIPNPVIKKKIKRKRDSNENVNILKRRVGRPKKLPVIVTAMNSITKYFRAL